MKNIWSKISVCCLLLLHCLPADAGVQPAHELYALYIRLWGLSKYASTKAPGGDKADKMFLQHLRLIDEQADKNQAWITIAKDLFDDGNMAAQTLPDNFADWKKQLSARQLLRADCGHNTPNIKYPAFEKKFIDKFDERNMPEAFHKYTSLLLLAKYWNIVEYFYPHKNPPMKPWPQVLTQYLPAFANAATINDARLAMLQLIAEIQDAHSAWPAGLTDVNAFKKNEFLFPYDGIIIKDSTYYLPTDPEDYLYNDKAHRITAINGKPVQAYIDSAGRFISSSSYYSKLREVKVDLVWDSLQSAFTVSCGSNLHTLQRNLTFASPELRNPIQFLHNDSILYLNFNRLRNIAQLETLFNEQTRDQIKYFFIDLRHGPGNFQSLALGKLLATDQPESQSSYGTFFCNDSLTFKVSKLNRGKGDAVPAYKGRIIVLVNEITQSSTETTCMMLQTNPNTIVLGTPTAGANGEVVYVNLPFGIRTQFTSVYFTYPNGKQIQRTGIQPDIWADIYKIKKIEDLVSVIHKYKLHAR